VSERVRRGETNLSTPLPNSAAETQPSKEPTRKDREDRARIIFGSRLAGPARRSELASRSRSIAGVLVPPKPVEPDNCCMSGCVNCVWDLFREDLEEWAAKSNEARAKLRAREVHREGLKTAHTETSMDDDGGGSEGLWTMEDLGGGEGRGVEDAMSALPVGIREFMRTEKMLKERHAAEERASAG